MFWTEFIIYPVHLGSESKKASKSFQDKEVVGGGGAMIWVNDDDLRRCDNIKIMLGLHWGPGEIIIPDCEMEEGVLSFTRVEIPMMGFR